MLLNAQISGSDNAPALIICHGLFGSSSNWRRISDQLKDTHQVHNLDMRNHGESPWHDVMDYAAMAADIEAYCTHQQIQKPVLMGHSMGGKAVMQAVLNGFKVAQLIVIDIAPEPYQHGNEHAELIKAMAALATATLSSRSEADEALSASIPNTMLRQFLLQNLVKRADGYTWRINLEVLANSLPNLMAFERAQEPVHCRCDFIFGALSSYRPDNVSESLHRLFPLAEHQLIDDAGHWLHAEQPARFVQTLKAILPQ